jgi:hypothetical protein
MHILPAVGIRRRRPGSWRRLAGSLDSAQPPVRLRVCKSSLPMRIIGSSGRWLKSEQVPELRRCEGMSSRRWASTVLRQESKIEIRQHSGSGKNVNS